MCSLYTFYQGKSNMSNFIAPSLWFWMEKGNFKIKLRRTRMVPIDFYAMVTLKPVPYEPRKAIFTKWDGTSLSRGSFRVFVSITGATWLLRGQHDSKRHPVAPERSDWGDNFFFFWGGGAIVRDQWLPPSFVCSECSGATGAMYDPVRATMPP